MRLSVCLATYNGARYIEAQLDSILPQLQAEDEVLVADDGSTDDTLARIAAYGSRVRIVATSRIGGVVPNFERVLAAADGEGIVLCDQDDVWLPGRLALIRQRLAGCLLVLTNGAVVDDALQPRGQNVFGLVGMRRGVLRNLVKNSFIGCCMAFRRELRDRVLPFPAGVPWHDWYIGLVAEAIGRVEREPSVTLLYRRHAANASPTGGGKSANSLPTMLRMRLAVARALLVAVLRRPGTVSMKPGLTSGSGSSPGSSLHSGLNTDPGSGSSSSTAPPRVLVLLASHNGAPWLRQQIDSILAQAGVAVDLVVGDDASLDATARLLHEGWPGEARIRYQSWDVSSGSAGANFRRLFRAVDSAGYDAVALADQDDIWHLDKLARALDALNRHDAQGYSAAVEAFWPDGRRKTMAQCARVRAADFLFEGAGQGCTFVLREALFARVRGFCIAHPDAADDLHYHDWMSYLLARAWGARWVFDAHPALAYRQHDSNEIGARGGLAAVRRRLAQIRNGWYRRQIGRAAALYRLAHPGDLLVERAARLLDRDDGLRRRLGLAVFALRHGRRRRVDRAVLVLSILLGWI